MEWYWAAALYTILCKVYIFLGMPKLEERKVFKAVMKCAPTMFLLAAVGVEMSQSYAPMSAAAPGSRQKQSRLFWGLVFSCIGDAYLVFPEFFLFGIVAFAIAQAIYTSLFGGGIGLFFEAESNELMSGLAIALIAVLFALYLLPKLKKVLVIPVVIYSCLISLMLWSAVVQLQRRPSDESIIGAIGASMFFTSDLLYAVNKWRLQIPYAQVFIMLTYYTAQLFITGSVLGMES